MAKQLAGKEQKKTLLNYTTTIDAARTITEIQQILAAKGAMAVQVEYDSKGAPSGLTFKIMLDNHPVWYRLPSKYDEAERALERTDIEPRYKTRSQAIRTCWRILKDWVEAQMGLYQMRQVELAEAFFPFAVDASSGMTLFDHWRESQKLLASGAEAEGRLELSS